MTTDTMSTEELAKDRLSVWLEIIAEKIGPTTDRSILLESATRLRDQNERLQTLEHALFRISAWPDGGTRYGQDNIKRFARETLDSLGREA